MRELACDRHSSNALDGLNAFAAKILVDAKFALIFRWRVTCMYSNTKKTYSTKYYVNFHLIFISLSRRFQRIQLNSNASQWIAINYLMLPIYFHVMFYWATILSYVNSSLQIRQTFYYHLVNLLIIWLLRSNSIFLLFEKRARHYALYTTYYGIEKKTMLRDINVFCAVEMACFCECLFLVSVFGIR